MGAREGRILKRTFETGVREKLIGKIHIYALDENEYCHARLTIDIDWGRYELHIGEGREHVRIDSRWKDNTAIELDETIKLFNDYCQSKRLKTICQINYAPNVDIEYARKKLGLIGAIPPKWYGKIEGHEIRIEELDEVKVGLYLSHE